MSPSSTSAAHRLAALALGPACWAVLAQLVARIPPAPGEGWGLRWLRVLAEHPLRGGLALALGLLALASPPSRTAQEPPSATEPTFL